MAGRSRTTPHMMERRHMRLNGMVLPEYIIPSSMVVCYGVFFMAMRSPTIKSMRDRLKEKRRKRKSGGPAKS
jgi:hypothetical protein